MAVKSSIHIKPCNISSSEAHNLRTPEYMRNIGEAKIYLIPQLVTDNEHWINPRFGDYDLQTHYDNIKQMVKAKTGRAMQEKERERKTKSGKIVKVAGCSPIREGVLLIKSETTLEDVADLVRSVRSGGASHRFKYSYTKTRGIGSVESQPLTIRRVFRLTVVGSNPTITLILYLIGWTTIRARAEN